MRCRCELHFTLPIASVTRESVSRLDTAEHQEAVGSSIKDCRDCITKFLVDVAKFEPLRNQKVSKNKFMEGFRKIQWATFQKGDVEKFKAELDTKISALEMHLLSFRMYVNGHLINFLTDLVNQAHHSWT